MLPARDENVYHHGVLILSLCYKIPAAFRFNEDNFVRNLSDLKGAGFEPSFFADLET